MVASIEAAFLARLWAGGLGLGILIPGLVSSLLGSLSTMPSDPPSLKDTSASSSSPQPCPRTLASWSLTGAMSIAEAYALAVFLGTAAAAFAIAHMNTSTMEMLLLAIALSFAFSLLLSFIPSHTLELNGQYEYDLAKAAGKVPPEHMDKSSASSDVSEDTNQPLIAPFPVHISAAANVPMPAAQNRPRFAIVGMGFRFPGQIETMEDFWEVMINKKCVTKEASARKWNLSKWTSKTQQPGKISTTVIGEVEGTDLWDNQYFQTSVREAVVVDPQQRQFLLCTAWALEDAGIPQDDVHGSNTGVYVGTSYMVAYLKAQLADPTVIGAHTLPGSALCVIANRVSYFYGLTGPSMAIDTACASTLTVLDVALQAINNGDCSMAIVGGVNPVINPEVSVGYAQLGVLAPDGKCKSFSDDANGYCRSEGYGVMVVKRLEDAIANNDHIYSVICDCSSNANGPLSDGITKPSSEAQAMLIEHTWGRAKMDLSTADYVEAHGTGTAVGDPIEANGLAMTFGAARKLAGLGPLPFGSSKSNIGHMEPAAGVASIVKACLMFKHRKLVPNANFSRLHRDIVADLVYVPTEVVSFPPEKVLTIGINGFGFGGSNSHVILQEYVPSNTTETSATLGWRFGVAESTGRTSFLPISATSDESLRAIARQWVDLEIKDLDASAVLSWKAIRTAQHNIRACIIANGAAELSSRAAKYGSGANCAGVVTGKAIDHAKGGGLAFVFSGQGPQHRLMGCELFKTESVFRSYIIKCNRFFRQASGYCFIEKTGLFHTSTSNAAMDRPDVAQPAICFFQIALYHQLLHWGVRPKSIVGHSVGEVAAAYAAGAFDLPTAMKLIFIRSFHQQQVEGCGRMLAVAVSANDIMDIIRRRGLMNVYIAAVNSPKSTTVAGVESEILLLKALCKEEYNIRSAVLGVSCAYHTVLMKPIEWSLKDHLAFLKYHLQDAKEDGPVLYSTVTGGKVSTTDLTAEYWWRNIALPVEFEQAVRGILENENPTLMLEIAPRNTLGSLVQQTIVDAKSDAAVVSTNDKNFPESEQHVAALAELYVRGVKLNFKAVFGEPSAKPTLPKYPFKMDLIWSEGAIHKWDRIGPAYLPFVKSRGIISTSMFPWVQGHVLQKCPVFPGTGYLEFVVENTIGEDKKTPFILQDVVFARPLTLPDDEKQYMELKQRVGDKFEVVVDVNTHCTGKVGAPVLKNLLRPSSSLLTKELMDELVLEAGNKFSYLSENDFYTLCMDMGFTYTSLHRAVRDVWKGDECAYYTVDTTEQLSDGYRFHPALLDCILHGGLCLLEIWSEQFVPASINMVIFHNFPAENIKDNLIVVKAEVVERQSGKVTVNVNGYTSDGIHLVEFHELVMRSASEDRRVNDVSKYLYNLQLQPKSNTTDYGHACTVARQHQNDYWRETAQANIASQAIPDLRNYVATMAQKALDEASARAAGPFIECVERLARCGVHVPNPKELLAELRKRIPFFDIELTITEEISRRLPDLIVSQALIGEIIYQPNLLPLFFRESFTVRSVYQQTAEIVDSIVRPKVREGLALRILEIGLRTGGLTKRIAERVEDLVSCDKLQYVAADISGTFFQDARENLAQFPWVTIQKFDFEKDVLEQGFSPCTFDVIIVFSTFHGSKDIDHALAATSQLLVPGGTMINVEPCCPKLGFMKELWFGSMDVWWRFTDFRRDQQYIAQNGREYGTCWLNQNEWVEIFKKHKYQNIVNLEDSPIKGFMFHTLLATKSITYPVWFPLVKHIQRVFVLSDVVGFANRTQTLFESSVTFIDLGMSEGSVIFTLRDLGSENMSNSLVLVNVENMSAYSYDQAASVYRIVLELMKVVQGPSGEGCGSGLVFCAKGIDTSTTNPYGAFFNGFVRPAAAEMALNTFVSIDFAPELDDMQVDSALKQIVDGYYGNENEYVVTLDGISVKRVQHLSQVVNTTKLSYDDSVYVLESDGSGTTDSVQLRRAPKRNPADDQLLIRVEYAGLNFKDVLMALNLLDGLDSNDVFGLGCVGIVEATGPCVSKDSFCPGDRVVALAENCLATHVLCSSRQVVRSIDGIDPVQLGCITIFATVVEALVNRANLKPGETVLIHSAMSGIGQCAIKLAHYLGATVIATAGTAEKRTYLTEQLGVHTVADSRSLGYVDVVKSVAPKGVDVVLNCLSGEHISASLHLCAPSARFVEIGKKDMLADNIIATRVLLQNISLMSCHIDLQMFSRPEYTSVLLNQTVLLMRTASLSIATKIYELESAQAAFKEAAKGNSLTKAVFKINDVSAYDPRTITPSSRVIPPDASVLIVGGLGGVGLELIESLARNGAKHLIVTSRSGIMTKKAQNIASSLAKKFGTTVYSFGCDVACAEACNRLATMIHSSGIPNVCGLYHLAAVFEDDLAIKLTPERFMKPLHIKARGLMNLVDAFGTDNLNFVIATASMNDIASAMEQTNYVAANTIMTSYCATLRAKGVFATSVGLGPVLGAGIIEQNPRVAKIMKSRGFTFISVHKIVTCLVQSMYKRLPSSFYVHDADSFLKEAVTVKGNLRWAHWQRPVKAAVLDNLNIESITAKLAAVFLMNPSDLDPNEPLVHYGVDSLLATELVQCIKNEMGVEVSFLDILSGITVSQINDIVQSKLTT